MQIGEQLREFVRSGLKGLICRRSSPRRDKTSRHAGGDDLHPLAVDDLLYQFLRSYAGFTPRLGTTNSSFRTLHSLSIAARINTFCTDLIATPRHLHVMMTNGSALEAVLKYE